MLKILDTITPVARSPVCRFTTPIIINEIRHRPIEERADLAARYLAGLVAVKPTGVLARYIFNASLSRIRDALDRLDTAQQIDTSDDDTPELEVAWSNATPQERNAFIRNHAAQFLRVIDFITKP